MNTHCLSARWPSSFAPKIKTKLKDFSGERLEKINSPRSVDFSPGSYTIIIFNLGRGSIKHVVTLTKIQSAREASHYLTLMDNCKIFYSHVFVFV